MNQKTARALRRAAGYKPGRNTEYHPGAGKLVNSKDVLGNWSQHAVTGTFTCTGARAKYKKLKRDKQLAAKIMEASRVQR